MTDRLSQEEELFEAEDIVPTTPPRLKRRSVSGRFPVVSSPEMSTPTGKISGGKGVGSGATSLGIKGAVKVSELVYEITGVDGSPRTFNIWTDVNRGANATSVEQVIGILVANPSLSGIGEFIDGVTYQGFDREFYISHALSIISLRAFCQFALLGAIRGSNFEKIRDSCTDMPPELTKLVSTGVVGKVNKKKTDLTILRFTASIPHWCAYWMLQHKVDKKISTHDCPSFLQFPGAASVPMSRELRLLHVDFCMEFSRLLPGGTFNVSIYLTAYKNLVPINSLPSDFLVSLGVSSNSEARTVKEDEITALSASQVVRR